MKRTEHQPTLPGVELANLELWKLDKKILNIKHMRKKL